MTTVCRVQQGSGKHRTGFSMSNIQGKLNFRDACACKNIQEDIQEMGTYMDGARSMSTGIEIQYGYNKNERSSWGNVESKHGMLQMIWIQEQ